MIWSALAAASIQSLTLPCSLILNSAVRISPLHDLSLTGDGLPIPALWPHIRGDVYAIPDPYAVGCTLLDLMPIANQVEKWPSERVDLYPISFTLCRHQTSLCKA